MTSKFHATASEIRDCPSCGPLALRLAEDSDVEDEYRTPFARDRDRLLYSSAFRRLAGVTQIAAVREQRLLHNRMTHSLKVAQIGRRLAERMLFRSELEDFQCRSGIYPDIVETAGLAHDMGHPPFGHIAEGVLEEGMRKYGGFEGNAQSFRIVTKLASRKPDSFGVNLTRGSLNAILKYPRRQNDPAPVAAWTDRLYGSKWGVYSSELREFRHARANMPANERSACAILMDWADDISYATHDIEDYFRAGIIPLHHLAADNEGFLEAAKKRLAGKHEGFDEFEFERQFYELLEAGKQPSERTFLPAERYQDSRESRVELNQKISGLIKTFVSATNPQAEPPYISIAADAQYKVEVLKELTWFYVIHFPPLALLQEGQQRIIDGLFQMLLEWLKRDPSSPRLPRVLRDLYNYNSSARSNRERRARAVCDYICILTEDQALDVYERMTGISRSSIFGAWFH